MSYSLSLGSPVELKIKLHWVKNNVCKNRAGSVGAPQSHQATWALQMVPGSHLSAEWNENLNGHVELPAVGLT